MPKKTSAFAQDEHVGDIASKYDLETTNSYTMIVDIPNVEKTATMTKRTIYLSLLYYLILVIVAWLPTPLHAQSAGGTTIDGIYVDYAKSDPKLRRKVVIRGNNIELSVRNYGFLGEPTNLPGGGVWPRGTEHDHLHSLTPFMASQVKGANGAPVVVVSHAYDLQMSRDPVTNIDQAFQPVPGYFNTAEGQNDIANQLNPKSWPVKWPGKDNTWSGYWNGYFGLNQKNADQESYSVMDDAYNTHLPFYPAVDSLNLYLPTAKDSSRRGLGLQIETRLFQWSHPLAQDVVFAHYQVSNIGSHRYTTTTDSIFFGVYSDINAGGRGQVDDNATFDSTKNLVFAWDNDNIGAWTKFRDIKPGYMGYKFLESPGLADDNKDNDDDGIIDERRDNDAGTFVFGSIGTYGAAKNHWSGDEDGDWNSITDDKGSDGIGPDEEGYPGKDADGTEGNGRPDQGEPNFGKTDKDESDQIGLTSFSAPTYGTVNITNELGFWPRIYPGTFLNPPVSTNQFWLFASGPFNLPPAPLAGWTQRYSVCFVFGADKDAIYRVAQVAQRIYDANYQFAKPPGQPIVKAVAGDKRVVLTWDSKAELSRDPIYHFDFEGYKVYKSTEAQFLEPLVITNAFGTKTFKQPAAQFDLIDSLKGVHPLQLGEEINAPQGIHYYMGSDNGLQHYWVDTNVINGRTYYYAVVAYDKGFANGFYEKGLTDTPFLLPITPSESPATINFEGGVINYMDPNTAYATPSPKASNYVQGTVDADTAVWHVAGTASGAVRVSVVSPEQFKNKKLIITFGDTIANKTGPSGTQVEIQTKTYSIYDSTTHQYIKKNIPLPKAVESDSVSLGVKKWDVEMLDQGLLLHFTNTFARVSYIQSNSGWEKPAKNNTIPVIDIYDSNSPMLPVNVVVEFADTTEMIDSTVSNLVSKTFRKSTFTAYELESHQRVQLFLFEKPANRNGWIDPDEYISVILGGAGATPYTTTWKVTFKPPTDSSAFVRPKKGEKFVLRAPIPFGAKDIYELNMTESIVRSRSSSSVLDRVTVVPNPYIEAAIWEQQSVQSGRGPRRIYFNNLPKQCTVRIYTLNGLLIKELFHDGGSGGNGSLAWDLTTKDGLEPASGLYVYHVDAPGIGEKIGKFAIVN
jgi:hypothetical protein